MILGTLFDKKMDKVRFFDGKYATSGGFSFAVLGFVVYSAYALGMRCVNPFRHCF